MKPFPSFSVNCTMMKTIVTVSKQWDCCLNSSQEPAVSLLLLSFFNSGMKMLLYYTVKLALTLYVPLKRLKSSQRYMILILKTATSGALGTLCKVVVPIPGC